MILARQGQRKMQLGRCSKTKSLREVLLHARSALNTEWATREEVLKVNIVSLELVVF